MAPWPEQETEPKAPDKTGAAAVVEKPCDAPSATMKEGGDPCKPTEENDPGVSNLDEQGLRELLDEAIAYKNPKDREQSSALFKELLAKAEADEREHSGGQRGASVIGSGRYRRGPARKGDVSERNSRGGSLQNLFHALNSDLDVHSGLSSNRKRGGRRNPQPQVSVSARQREGGSLPCNVNADYYTAAALLRGHDDVGSSSASVKKRDHTTPIDDVVTGNSYSYKLSSANSARTADDLSGYRPCNTAKRATGSVDDIETAAPRGSGIKRRELRKLGHSSDGMFPESVSDDIRSMEDLSKESESGRLGEIKNNDENINDICASDFAPYCLSRQNNVEKTYSDHPVIELDNQSHLNRSSMLGVGINGTVRSGSDHRWMKSDSRKDDEMDGTEMTPIDRNSEIPKYSQLRPNEHEVDQPIFSEFLPRKTSRSNGELMVQLFEPNFAAGESIRSTLDSLGEAARSGDKAHPRTLFRGYQVSRLQKDINLLQAKDPVPSLPTFLSAGKDPEKKNFDENGNALHQGMGSERKFKARKNKTDNNNYVLAEKIPGHRGDIQDINELLLFIESASDCQDIKSSVSGKNSRNSNGPVSLKDSKQRNSSSNGKRSEEGGPKVKSEKRKPNEKQKLKKSNSLEEISCTKLSDLTSSDHSLTVSGKGAGERQPRKQSTLDDEDLSTGESSHKVYSAGCSGSDRHSWGSEETAQTAQAAEEEISSRSRKRKGSEREDRKRGRGSGSGSSNRKQRESSDSLLTTASSTESSNTAITSSLQGIDTQSCDPAEFHVVTKKQRKKKSGRSSSIGRNEKNHNYAQSNNYHRESNSRKNAVDNNEGNSILYQYRTAPYRSESPDHNQHQRRKSTSSMPPSDKSADSSDLDSVHSLPISSTTPRPVLDKTSTSSGSTPQASYADIARMASAGTPPQGPAGCTIQSPGSQTPNLSDALSQSKWPSVGQTRPSAPLWTANVTLHSTTATPLPPSQEEGDQCYAAPVPPVSSSLSSSTKQDASVGNLLSDLSYPPLSDCGKSPVTQCVQTFISQASRTSPAISPGVTMASCVDVEDSAKRAASPAAFDSVRDISQTSTLDRPAVIILDEEETETPANGDPELTFGFEINEMLLSGACSVSSEDEAEAKIKSSVSIQVQPSLTSVANINLDKIVAFVGRAWEDVIRELPQEPGARGRVQFYNGQ